MINCSKKHLIRKTVSLLLVLVMMVSLFGNTQSLQAAGENPDGQSGRSRIMTADGCRFEFSVTSVWNGGYNVNAVITNMTDKNIDNWAVELSANEDIYGLWNAVECEDREADRTVIKNAGFNKDIAAHDSVYFGYSVNAGRIMLPTECRFVQKRMMVEETDYEVWYSLADGNRGNFNGKLYIRNMSDKAVEDWDAEISPDFGIICFF